MFTVQSNDGVATPSPIPIPIPPFLHQNDRKGFPGSLREIERFRVSGKKKETKKKQTNKQTNKKNK